MLEACYETAVNSRATAEPEMVSPRPVRSVLPLPPQGTLRQPGAQSEDKSPIIIIHLERRQPAENTSS